VPSRKSLVVVNLRAQPVELHYGGEVVVVPEFAHTELPKLPGEEGQLAELARRGAVTVQTAAAEPPAPQSRRKPKPKPRPAKPKPKPKAKAKPARRRSSTT
jgi:hypothetical protein